MIGRVAPVVALLGLGLVGSVSACASDTNGTPGSAAPLSTSSSHTFSSSTPVTSSSAPSTPATSGSTSSSAPATSSTHPVPAEPLRTTTVTASDGTVYAISVWAQTESRDCAAHAYGQVAQFLATHRCTGIRQLIATTAINGKSVGFAQNSVGFAGGMNTSYRSAGTFSELVTENGTGNLNDLLREGYRLPAGPDHVPSPDAFEALGQDAGVVVTDAWFLDRPTPDNDPRLRKMARDIFLQF